ncbi:hypothetical protein K1T71_001181 [Dendrolimus kikuchii]|uniref:Uncharacterized protein n=1 Tax=Dendrolimus kikuchii TaxID=765133 RepID=A0ACC1DHB9_9NEOP|nr:hypothetical protein K1T71_001181 [Dendrolimus kikuchii]
MFPQITLLVLSQYLILSSSQNLSVPIEKLTDNQIIVPRVVNGKTATVHDVPYQISFKKRSSYFGLEYTSFCGGTLLKPRKILSAAHCFEEKLLCKPCSSVVVVPEKKRKRIMAVAGNLKNKDSMRWFSRNTGQWRELRKIMYPSSYEFPVDDIALAFTYYKFRLDSTVKTIPYAATHEDYKGTCRISGFGRTSDTSVSAILLYADVEVISSSQCTKMHKRRMSKFICTSDLVSDVHKGDSGGPLVCNNSLVGVVSGNRPKVGSFFTRVSAYKDFIEKPELNREAIKQCAYNRLRQRRKNISNNLNGSKATVAIEYS